MALTQIAFCDVGFLRQSSHVPVAHGETLVSEAITPSGSNQQSSASTKNYARISTDTAIYVAFGADPNASTGTGSRAYMPADSVEYFHMEVGNKVAVVTA